VKGVARILSLFWELLPTGTINEWLTQLVTKHAFDVSSSLVRVAVVEGLTFMLDNPLAQPLLKSCIFFFLLIMI
jgi:condensin-2 complex subunit G2